MDTKKHDEALREIQEKLYSKGYLDGSTSNKTLKRAVYMEIDNAITQIRSAGYIHKSEVVLDENKIILIIWEELCNSCDCENYPECPEGTDGCIAFTLAHKIAQTGIEGLRKEKK